jgi:cysteine-rich repeat protein
MRMPQANQAMDRAPHTAAHARPRSSAWPLPAAKQALRDRVRRFLVLLAAAFVVFPAYASFHLMKVVEVFLGSPAAPNAQYVVIQMYSANQAAVSGHKITVFNSTGGLVGTFTFGGTPTNPKPSQTKILIATAEAAALFNVPADLTMTPVMLAAGGKVCFDAIPEDCVAWSGWTGGTSGVGTPFHAGGPFPPGRAAIRRLDISGGATTLESTDDTNVCSTDFVEGLPAPRNSNGTNGTTPASTCGNGAVEGLEQCDDHNTLDGDSCSSTCATTVPTTNLSIGDASVAEGNSGTKTLTFTVSLSQPPAGPVTYDIATANGTALAGSDYVARSLTGETLAAGVQSKTFAVTLNGDTTVEANETFAVNVTNVAGAGVADASALGSISNDDLPTLSIADASVSEGNSGTKTLAFTVSLSQASAGPVTYDIATANGTASAGSDYVASSLTGQAIPAGQLSKSFAVTLNGDTAVENNETFVVNVTNAAGAGIADGQATGTIANDDLPTLSIADAAVAEGNSGTKSLTFTVTLSTAVTQVVGFNASTTGAGNATAGSDYTALASTAFSIPAGQTTNTFTVTINGDTDIEANEVFVAALSGATGATFADGAALGTITNDDAPSLAIGDASVVEGNSGTKLATFTVTLSRTSPFVVSFTAATTGAGNATAGVDYVALASTGFTIPAGTLSKTVSVTLNGDTTIEADEYFVVAVANVVNATVFDGAGLGTIANDDKPTLSIGDVTITEGNSGTKLATFTVTQSQAAPYAVTFSAATTGAGTATPGVDYVALALTGQTIAAGALSKTVSVTLNGDTTVEANETYVVSLSNANGATLADGSALGIITNDD